jgi:hypothetical protein
MRLWSWLCAVLILVTSCATSPPVAPNLPCTSPKKLKEAVRYVISTGDTDLLWDLHYWGNASPQDQANQKRALLSILGIGGDERKTFKEFDLLPAPFAGNVPVRRRDGTIVMQTLPISGFVTLTGVTRRPTPNGKPIKSRFSNMPLPFGRDTKGNYWLTAMHVVSTNSATPRR